MRPGWPEIPDGKQSAASGGSKKIPTTVERIRATTGANTRRSCLQKERAAEALRYFDAALEIAPDFYEAQLNRAVALTLAGDDRGAAEQLRRLLANLPAGAGYDRTRDAARTLLLRVSVAK